MAPSQTKGHSAHSAIGDVTTPIVKCHKCGGTPVIKGKILCQSCMNRILGVTFVQPTVEVSLSKVSAKKTKVAKPIAIEEAPKAQMPDYLKPEVRIPTDKAILMIKGFELAIAESIKQTEQLKIAKNVLQTYLDKAVSKAVQYKA